MRKLSANALNAAASIARTMTALRSSRVATQRSAKRATFFASMRASMKILGLALVTSAATATADIYRWVDARGVVNYTQQKPNNVPSTLVGKATAAPRFRGSSSRQSDNNPAPAATAGTSDAELTAAQQERLEELKAQEEAKAAQLANRQQQSCDRAQSVLEQLTSNSRIKIRGEDGSVRAIGEDERQERINETQLSIAEHCVS